MKSKYFFLVLTLLLGIVFNVYSQTTEICNNGIDDDGDGLIDCIDPDCMGSPGCDSLNPGLKGVVEGTGTYFEITNSDYLNVTLSSSNEITIFLSSVPQMISMNISKPATAPTPYQATLTINGLLPSTVYYKYDDSYHNLDSITTDANGNYTWTQDLSEAHHVWIQPTRSTIFICDDATGCGCEIVGTWNQATKTCTLTIDVTETIQIDSPGITLDGNNHSITGSGTGYGIYFSEKDSVTIKNCVISNFSGGIYLSSSSNGSFSGNTISTNYYGISGYASSLNNITGNTVSYSTSYGIHFNQSSNNTLINNVANSNSYGIYLQAGLGGNTLTSNTTNLNTIGIYLYNNPDNILTNNISTSNSYSGLIIAAGSNNTLNENTVLNNNGIGIVIQSNSNIVLTNNNASYNTQDGIQITSGSNHNISGNTASFNTYNGIRLSIISNCNISNNTVESNNYGLYLYNNTGNNFLGNNISSNNEYGIYATTCQNNTIGGTGAQQPNMITNNGISGIYLTTSNSIKISGNSIYNNLIAVKNLDGSNNNKAAPVITSFDGATITGTSDPNDTIEIFGSTGAENANEYIASCLSDGSGYWTIPASTNYDYITATATSSINNTSKLSNPLFNGYLLNTDSILIFEAPILYRNSHYYTKFFKIRTINNEVIPCSSSNEVHYGTSCISDSAISLRSLLENFIIQGGGTPDDIRIERYNLDDYINNPKAENIYKIYFPVFVEKDSLNSQLKQNPYIESANPPYIIRPTTYTVYDQGVPTNPYPLWYINKIQAPDAWVFLQNIPSNTGRVGVVDQGYAWSDHLELDGKIIFSLTPSCALNDIGLHATKVSSVVCSNSSSVPADGTIGVGRDFLNVTSHNINCGINEAFIELSQMVPAVRVANCSFLFQTIMGPPMHAKFKSYNDVDINLIALEEFIINGGTVVASSGNFMSTVGIGTGTYGCPNTPYCFSARGVGYPFGLPNVIGVGATAPNYVINPPSSTPSFEFGMGSGNDPNTYYQGGSSGGNYNYNYFDLNITDPHDLYNQSLGYLDLVAPGVNIDVASTLYNDPSSIEYVMGTSLSSPIVASVAASMLLVNPGLNRDDISRILFETADKVGYNPSGLQYGELNGNTSFTKGYLYNNGGMFQDDKLDWVMGHGRVNMLSAIMNAASTNPGGFTISAALFTTDRHIRVNNVNDHNYLSGFAYNERYEYDAVLNQDNATLHFLDAGTFFELANNSSFRISNNSTMTFDNGADLHIESGSNGQATKYVVETDGHLELNDITHTYIFPSSSLLEVNNGGELIIGGNLNIEAGATLHIKNGATLELNGNILIESGGYVCIEQGSTVINNGSITFTPGFVIGVNPNVNIPNIAIYCTPPCDLPGNINGDCLALELPTLVNESCTSGNDGSITVNATGGDQPYSYLWSNGQTTQTAIGLVGGTYSVTVTDDIGSTVVGTYTISGQIALQLSFSSTDISCYSGASGGTATVTSLNGTSPFTYLWSNGYTTSTISGLPQGTYYVTVSDALGCTFTGFVDVNINAAHPPFDINIVQTDVSCNGGNNGSIMLSLTGYNAWEYDVTWYNSNGILFANTHNVFNLQADSYTAHIVDDAGCEENIIIQIVEPAEMSATFTNTPASACLNNDGSSEINVTGGTSPYYYLWPSGNNNQIENGLVPGTYNVTVTDSYGCTAEFLTVIENNSATAPVLSFVTNNATCFNSNDGNITMSITGGTVPYSITWSTGSISPTIQNIPPGIYTVTVNDAATECSHGSIEITSPDVISATITYIPMCNGMSVHVDATGGTPPYNITWGTTPVQTGPDAIGLQPGFYSFTVTDQNNCDANYNPSQFFGVTASDIPSFDVSVITSNSSGCTNADGFANVNEFFFGTSPYSFIWSNGQSTQSAVGLSAGSYSVTVTDNSGCTVSKTITINSSSALWLDISHTNVTCNSSNNGTAHATANGGTPPYNYTWGTSPTQIGPDAVNLSPGLYMLTATDAIGLCIIGSININTASGLIATIHHTPPTCNAPDDGTAKVVSVDNGTPPYTYLWSASGQTTQTAYGLTQGTYSVTVTDVNSCSTVGTVTVPSSGINTAITNPQPVWCYGGATGVIGVYVVNNYGNPPYSFLWAGGETTPYIYNLTAGTYSVTVTDAGACSSVNSITLLEPPEVVLTTSSTDATSCLSSDGTATVIATGGTPPFNYSWVNSPGQYGATAHNLLPGSYNVVVWDSHNCTFNLTIDVGPQSVSVDAGNNVTICSGETTTLTATSGFSSYLWSDNAGNTSSVDVSPTSDHTYYVTVTDDFGCIGTDYVTVTVNPIPVWTYSYVNPCNDLCDGSASVTVTSGMSPTFLWQNLATTSSISGLCVGNYSVTITIANGCTGVQPFVLTDDYIPTITSISITSPCAYVGPSLIHSSNAVGATSYAWQFDDGSTSANVTPSLSYSEPNYHCVTLTASNHCGSATYSEPVFLFENECPCPYNVNYDPLPGPVTSTVTVTNQDFIFDGTIVITGAGNLTVSGGQIQFSPKGRIVVEPGGTLNLLNDVKLTSLDGCTSMWQGIEVMGNKMVPSSFGVQGVVSCSEYVTISDAHIGILAGARNMDNICDPTGSPNPFSIPYSGGRVSCGLTTFENNGVGVYFCPHGFFYNATDANYITNCTFETNGVLNDPHYDSDDPLITDPYPNVNNPFTGYANTDRRGDCALFISSKTDLSALVFNKFTNFEFDILSDNSQFNVDRCNFYNSRYGILCANTVSSAFNRHVITGCTFDNNGSNTGMMDEAIHIEGGRYDFIQPSLSLIPNRINLSASPIISGFQKGIVLLNSSGFRVCNTDIYYCETGIYIQKSSPLGGFVGAMGPNWEGNQMTNCVTGVLGTGGNQKLMLKCNVGTTQSTFTGYYRSWDIYGKLANQGSAVPQYMITCPGCPASNRFYPQNDPNYKIVESSDFPFTYYYHQTTTSTQFLDPNTITLANKFFNASNTYTTAQQVCFRKFYNYPPLPVTFSVTPFTKLDSIQQVITDLTQLYQEVEQIVDGGETQVLLDAIYSSMSQGNLKNLLINHSPLSDTTLITLINSGKLSAGNLKNVMELNLPVSDNVYPYFQQRLGMLPSGIANHLRKLQGNNPGIMTLMSIDRAISQNKTEKTLLLNDFIIILTDTAQRYNDALNLLEAKGGEETDMLLASTYMQLGDYAETQNKLNSIPVVDQETADWISLMEMMLSLYQDSTSLYDLDAGQLEFIYNLAYSCPPVLGTGNAKSILLSRFREQVPDCPLELQSRTISPDEEIRPSEEIWLGENYPDPASSQTNIPYYLPKNTEGRIEVYDAYGKVLYVSTIITGTDVLSIRMDNWKPGVYYYCLKINGSIQNSKKLIVIK